MIKHVLFPVVLMLCGCSAARHSVAAEANRAGLPADYFSQQERCFDAWQAVVDDWIAGGGGMRKTVSETRQAIARDERSKLALIIRGVWKKRANSASADHGKLVAIFGSVASREMPEGCSSIIWLQPLLVEPSGVIPEDARVSLLAEAPIDARESSRRFGQWLSFALLTPEPGWRKAH